LRNSQMSRSPHTRDDVGTPCVRVRACLPPIQMPRQPCTINTLSITPTSVPNSGGYLFWPGAPSHSSPHSPASRQRTHITNRLKQEARSTSSTANSGHASESFWTRKQQGAAEKPLRTHSRS
ncbi:hypothetical protein TGVAND_358120, partial [Toxoplasma gondii VAND]